MADDRASNPGTEPFVPDFRDFEDTGSQPSLVIPELEQKTDKSSEKKAEKDELAENDGASPPDTPAAEGSATPVAVPGRYQYVKWWKLLLVLFGAWFAAAEVGLSLFYWWFHTIDKTAPVYVVLVYIVACTVAGLMLSMVEARPMITALSLGVMSGPFASLAAAAPLYGYYSCARIGNCLFGFIPY